ncbi:MAG: hypothetical protein IKO47_02475, partial [Ruminococcus sp.]|nr:hypothetical protein [Ruminococcus sp.]
DDDDDEEDTTATTTKKKTIAKVTEKATEKATEKETEKPASAETVVGKWAIPQELLDKMDMDQFDLGELEQYFPNGVQFENMYIEFKDGDEWLMHFDIDFSPVMSLSIEKKDGKDEISFTMVSVTLSEVTDDGTYLTIGAGGQEMLKFKHRGSGSSTYGEYTWDELSDAMDSKSASKTDAFKKMDIFMNFPSAGKSSMVFEGIGEYSFNADKNTLKIDGIGGKADVDFDGNKMTWEADGEKLTFTRLS